MVPGILRFQWRGQEACPETKMTEENPTQTRLDARAVDDNDAPCRFDVYVYIVVLAGAMLVAGLS
jgi:hypothetical protein